MIEAVGLDADDTLWENEAYFRASEAEFATLMADYGDHDDLTQRLYETERQNLVLYGFGVKGFTLSMIQTAIEVSESRLPAPLIGRILELGQAMLTQPVTLINGVIDTLDALSDKRLILITKGDLIDQQRKIRASGLAGYFDEIEVLADKTVQAYRQVLATHGIEKERFLMAGNSVVSDVLPVLEAGARAALIPHNLTWQAEHADDPQQPGFYRLRSICELPELIAFVEGGG